MKKIYEILIFIFFLWEQEAMKKSGIWRWQECCFWASGLPYVQEKNHKKEKLAFSAPKR